MSKDRLLSSFENQYRPRINQFLNQNLKTDVDEKILFDSMHYSLMAGGKRLRPMLTLATLLTFQKSISEDELKASCALELLHTYSLIHDDLPAMDNDDLRRNEPTNHRKYGAGMATLAGDGLLTLAFQWLSDNHLSKSVKTNLVLALSKASGPSGMVSGQSRDIRFENHRLPLSQLQILHRHKTGALIHYAVKAGLIMGHVSDDMNPLLLKFADSYGLAFQIYDDILDVVGTEEQLGKPVHQDQNKNTYPNLIGLDQSYDKLKQVINNGKQSLKQCKMKYQVDTSLLNAFFSYFNVE
ncbi:farnesyl-diphosphate synthase [Philodulcilactobacillus myokoensis]|uniref:Farnesyl diphosphate synthase n=1 Tax=Philodulcilactobacillus myokoensis TaxID=2929573 RepID=A0A9W6B191_9LACO|nr:farnesyl diphosphate synthase [Philodulcilactobacillus myokoensis]GLB46803.1 farnesyl-diphosphate synthase [Philodulcilactobacillus myokoensis]